MEKPDYCASPLSAVAIRQAAIDRGLDLPPAVTLDVISSTNDAAAKLAREGAPSWTLVSAEQQSAGRGRLDRSWESPAGSGLLFSVVLRPPLKVALSAYGWLPLMAGVAVTRAVNTVGIGAQLKWPNDVILDGPAWDGSSGPRKLAGILAERGDGFVIVGVGLNVSGAQADLPIPAATSVLIESEKQPPDVRLATALDRTQLLISSLAEWQALWSRFVLSSGDAATSELALDYRKLCATIGRTVRADIAGGDPVVGTATDIDSQGHLIVESDVHRRVVSAADVTHLRT